MTEIHLRLSELRDAAEQLRQSNRHIAQSLTRVSDIINELTVLGMDEAQFQLLGRPPILSMNNWTQNLNHFADKLNTAADDIENAVQQEFLLPHFDLSLLPERERTPLAVVPEIAIINTGNWYVSSANRPLFLNLRDQQTALGDQQSERTSLIDQRQAVFSELQATRNRALSHDPNLDLNTVPRIQTLETEITRLDEAILQHDTKIVDLNNELDSLSTRLDSVQPSNGADLYIVSQMDDTETNPYVVANTYDCVNHVVQKLPIPNDMALDAHMWNDLALAHPEYGITVSDTPLEGAVIVLEREHSYADNIYGHLLYVESVSDGEIWVTDHQNTEPIRFSDLTSETSGDNISYLYFPWNTRA